MKNIPILKHPQLIIFCRFAFLQFQPIRIQCHGCIKIIEFRENHEAKTGDLRNFWIFSDISVFWTCDFGTYTQRGKKHGSSLTLTKSKHQKTTKNYPILNHETWFLAIFAKPNCISFQKPSNDLKNDSKMMFKNDLSMNSPEKPWHQKSLPCPWNQGSPNRCSVLFGLLIWAGSSARKVLFGSGIAGPPGGI